MYKNSFLQLPAHFPLERWFRSGSGFQIVSKFNSGYFKQFKNFIIHFSVPSMHIFASLEMKWIYLYFPPSVFYVTAKASHFFYILIHLQNVIKIPNTHFNRYFTKVSLKLKYPSGYYICGALKCCSLLLFVQQIYNLFDIFNWMLCASVCFCVHMGTSNDDGKCRNFVLFNEKVIY